MKFASTLSKGRPLSALEIFWNFAKDTFVTGGIYILLIIVTIALKYSTHSLENSPIHYNVIVFLEYAIFFSGSLIVLLILAYLTVISILELKKSFTYALAEIGGSELAGNSANNQVNKDASR